MSPNEVLRPRNSCGSSRAMCLVSQMPPAQQMALMRESWQEDMRLLGCYAECLKSRRQHEHTHALLYAA